MPVSLLALLLGIIATSGISQDPRPKLLDCAYAHSDTPICRVHHQWSVAEVQARLAGRPAEAWGINDELTIAARSAGDAPELCCDSIGAAFDRVEDSDLWTLTLHIAELNRAIFPAEITLGPAAANLQVVFRGVDAPAAPRTNKLTGRVAEETIASERLGENRKVSIYLPPGFDPSRRYPVVYLADGYAIPDFASVVEPPILKGELPPFVMVGVWPTLSNRWKNLRGHEYLIELDRGSFRYHAYEAFVIEEVMPLAETRYGASNLRDDRIVAGFSDGAAWAVSMGLQHADLFGRVFAFSFGYEPAGAGVRRADGLKLFLGAGSLESFYLNATQELAEHARESKAEVVFERFVSGHSLLAWQPMMLDALRWAFRGAAK